MTAHAQPRRSAGQATVELALGLPLLMIAVLLVVQVGLVVRDQVRTVAAAREGARAAAVGGDATAAALSSSGMSGAVTTVAVSGGGAAGASVTVEVRFRSATDVALVGPLLPDPLLEARATMRVEG